MNQPNSKIRASWVAAPVLVVLSIQLLRIGSGQTSHSNPLGQKQLLPDPVSTENAVELTSNQLSSIGIDVVGKHLFPIEREAVGTIDFDQDASVQVFPTVQGKLLKTFAQLGDEVVQGQPLYSVDSPDLVQAESTLISAAGNFELTTRQLERVKALGQTNGIAQKELDQATSEQQAAEGALKAAREAVRVFGKTDTEIDRLIAQRQIDPALVVVSPLTGQISARNNAAPGYLVQPGAVVAPYTVSDLSVKWMLASVPEGDTPLFHAGQPVHVAVLAYPGRVFEGKISKVYAAVDPTTHRTTIRSEIRDERNELRPGMLANFTIEVQAPLEAVALPVNGVVRESDGTMTAWVTADRHRFVQRVLKTGLRSGGLVQILEGINPGELAVTDGAVFLSNMLNAPPSD